VCNEQVGCFSAMNKVFWMIMNKVIIVDIITSIYNIMIKVFVNYCPCLIMFNLLYETTCVNFIAMKLKYMFRIVSITYMFVVISYRWN
jgi:hypothetical protein